MKNDTEMYVKLVLAGAASSMLLLMFSLMGDLNDSGMYAAIVH